MLGAVLLVAAAALGLYLCRTFGYWRARGVKHDRPIPIFGTNLSGYLLQKSITQVAVDVYWNYPNEKIVGFFRSSRPELVIRDPEIVKRILVTDFNYFYPRGLNPCKTAIEPLLRNLFFADGDLWRLLRQRMSPMFSSGRLRAMFPLIATRASRLQARALEAASAASAASAATLDARDLMARYTTDFIGAVGFGLDSDSLADDRDPVRQLGAKIFKVGIKDAVVAILKEIFPETFKHWKYLGRAEADVFGLVRQILERRNYEPSERNDFIDLLLECKKKGKIIGESIEKTNSDGTPVQVSLEMTEELLGAQVFVFFAAGFETSSSATSFTLHQLAYHPEVQRKVQAEVDRVLSKYDNELSYDAIQEMTYLEWTFKEAMRMFPSLGFLIRECARKYTIPEIGVDIDPGVGVVIPLQALHNDPQYFPEPEQFRPERFHPANIDANNHYVYLPFGAGPRACIGARLGLLQSVAGLAALLARCSVAPAPASRRHPRVDPKADIVQCIQGGLPLMFHKRTTNAMLPTPDA